MPFCWLVEYIQSMSHATSETLHVPHYVSVDQARGAADEAWGEYAKKFASYRPTCAWEGNRAKVSFTVFAQSVSGTLTIDEGEIVVHLSFPYILRPYRKPAIEAIRREIHDRLDNLPAT